MAFITLDFLNKNMLRKYPIWGKSTHICTNGRILPTSLISSIQVTTPFALRNVYISKIYAKSGFVSILLRESTTNQVLGTFSGPVTRAHTRLTLIPAISNVSGTVTIGDPEAINVFDGAGYLNPDDGRLEQSTVFCFTPPPVTSFSHSGKKATGLVSFLGDNVRITTSLSTVTLNVVDPALIMSKKDFSGVLGNCETPLIKKINTVEPDNAGNINIYGIEPIVLGISTGQLGFTTQNLTLNDFCPERNKLTPPTDNTNSTYYADIFTVTDPEWKNWPQFREKWQN